MIPFKKIFSLKCLVIFLLNLSGLAINGQNIIDINISTKEFLELSSKKEYKGRDFFTILDEYNIKFTFPLKGNFKDGTFPLKNSSLSEWASKTIVSKDNNCFILLWTQELMSLGDSTETIKRMYKGGVIVPSPSDTMGVFEANSPNRKHLKVFREVMKQKEYITYYPTERAKLMYNADTVILIHPPADIDMDLARGVINFGKFREDYPYEQTLIIQKNGRGFIYMDCYFTTKGIKRSKKYIESLGNIFWFIDD